MALVIIGGHNLDGSADLTVYVKAGWTATIRCVDNAQLDREGGQIVAPWKMTPRP